MPCRDESPAGRQQQPRRGLAALALLMATGLPATGHAADPAGPVLDPAPAADMQDGAHPGWALQITPYVWAASLKGDISPFRRGPTISVEKPFSDVFDELNVAAFLNIYGRYERFVLVGDIIYVDTTDAHEVGALPVIGPVPTIGVSADSRQFIGTLMGGYRVAETADFNIALLGGVRGWDVSNTIRVSTPVGGASYSESFGWVDPIIGARLFTQFSDRLSLQAQADIGGFGAGSDLTWHAVGSLNYEVTRHLSLSAGYKVLDVDYRSDGHVFDVTLQGPVLGLTYRF